MYLLDTNVVSELRKSKPHGAVVAWIQTVPDNELFISALTLGELQAGAERTRKQDQGKATSIENCALPMVMARTSVPGCEWPMILNSLGSFSFRFATLGAGRVAALAASCPYVRDRSDVL